MSAVASYDVARATWARASLAEGAAERGLSAAMADLVGLRAALVSSPTSRGSIMRLSAARGRVARAQRELATATSRRERAYQSWWDRSCRQPYGDTGWPAGYCELAPGHDGPCSGVALPATLEVSADVALDDVASALRATPPAPQGDVAA